jgi:hypothetical protein
VARIALYIYVRWGNTEQFLGGDGVIESLDVLLHWMEEDPVDTWEMGRNDSVESITGTRNVFVDYPELAFALFDQEIPTDMDTPSGEARKSGMAYTILSLEGFYGVEALRRTESGGYYVAYRVHDGGSCFVFLRDMVGDGASLCVTHSLYVSDALNKQALRGIEVGDSRAAVEAADPATTVNRAPETGKCSLHWVDNEIFIFTYDESGETVTGVEHYPDGRVPSSVDGWYFDYNLLPVDRI